MKTLLITLAIVASAQASAQGVYKCVKDGRTSYSETPCAAGQVQLIEVPPPPPAIDKGAATRQQRVADQLESTRKKREEREDAARARANMQSAEHEQHCAQLRLQQKWAAQDAVGAGDKTREAAQLKVRRASERLALDCLN
ncbi:DUF4124 domain-containing protein [Janthinobacterium aquaticum]|uniref:DUF4124 domain-containing protein n=1 Tax=Janthinobacterium sp. FT58W TaxID=2654254 RepID=UPI00126466B5|nr:DUF4124 domain-containing protein [Janthinobacterium sp. FT58W]KAB8044890.1 DUF4124 domain-containing protein [Janthinobacterium sp. FT58W]